MADELEFEDWLEGDDPGQVAFKYNEKKKAQKKSEPGTTNGLTTKDSSAQSTEQPKPIIKPSTGIADLTRQALQDTQSTFAPATTGTIVPQQAVKGMDVPFSEKQAPLTAEDFKKAIKPVTREETTALIDEQLIKNGFNKTPEEWLFMSMYEQSDIEAAMRKSLGKEYHHQIQGVIADKKAAAVEEITNKAAREMFLSTKMGMELSDRLSGKDRPELLKKDKDLALSEDDRVRRIIVANAMIEGLDALSDQDKELARINREITEEYQKPELDIEKLTKLRGEYSAITKTDKPLFNWRTGEVLRKRTPAAVQEAKEFNLIVEKEANKLSRLSTSDKEALYMKSYLRRKVFREKADQLEKEIGGYRFEAVRMLGEPAMQTKRVANNPEAEKRYKDFLPQLRLEEASFRAIAQATLANKPPQAIQKDLQYHAAAFAENFMSVLLPKELLTDIQLKHPGVATNAEALRIYEGMFSEQGYIPTEQDKKSLEAGMMQMGTEMLGSVTGFIAALAPINYGLKVLGLPKILEAASRAPGIWGKMAPTMISMVLEEGKFALVSGEDYHAGPGAGIILGGKIMPWIRLGGTSALARKAEILVNAGVSSSVGATAGMNLGMYFESLVDAYSREKPIQDAINERFGSWPESQKRIIVELLVTPLFGGLHLGNYKAMYARKQQLQEIARRMKR
jgi:hypothetical protein